MIQEPRVMLSSTTALYVLRSTAYRRCIYFVSAHIFPTQSFSLLYLRIQRRSNSESAHPSQVSADFEKVVDIHLGASILSHPHPHSLMLLLLPSIPSNLI